MLKNPAIEENVKISYETLWKAIIRPPRDEYFTDELGPNNFKLLSKIYIRKDYTILNEQGYKLKLSFIEPDPKYRPKEIMPVIIYLHANSSCRIEGLEMKNIILSNNINLCVFDFAGSGQSDGEYISLGYYEQKDTKVVIDFIEKLPGVGKIALWGRSMGAATALLYSGLDKRISCICVDSPFADFRRLAKEMCLNVAKIPGFLIEIAISVIGKTVKNKNGTDINQIKPIKCVQNIHIPGLFIHAEKDELVPFQHSVDLCELYEGERKLLSCEGGHNSKRPKYILEEIIRFFCKNLVFDNEDYENIVINSEVNDNKESKKINENKKKIKRSDSGFDEL
jgi:pimeloyl-ACP methyl ester carboxylesterase